MEEKIGDSTVVESQTVETTQVSTKSNKTLYIVLAVIGVLLLCCCSCFGVIFASSILSERNTSKSNTLVTVTPTKSSDVGTPATAYAIGETAKIQDLDIKINSVADYTATNSSIPPLTGYKYIAANITITNNKSKSYSISPLFMFKIYDTAGNGYDLAYVTKSPALPSRVESGKSVTGNVVFEVTDNAKNLRLQVTPDFVDEESIIFSLD